MASGLPTHLVVAMVLMALCVSGCAETIAVPTPAEDGSSLATQPAIDNSATAAPSVSPVSSAVPSTIATKPAALPSATPTATATAVATPAALIPTVDAPPMRITVIYDNYSHDPRLATAWGFACLIERGATTVLFDTGGDGNILLANMATLGIDPRDIETVVLSHSHGDHTGGLDKLLPAMAHPTVYAPRAFPEELKARIRKHADLVEVHNPLQVVDGISTTGEMGTSIVEQALVLDAGPDTVIITGCAHPGIVAVIKQAEEMTGKPAGLVLGGFHLGDASANTIQTIVDEFVAMSVRRVAPSHCTGDQAIALFREAYGTNYIASGCGQGFQIP